MKFTRCGLDIGKQVFQVHGVNEHGAEQGRRTLARVKALEFFAQVPPCLIGIEACGSAHYWARELTKFGHTVKLMATQYVMAYRKRAKNDANDVIHTGLICFAQRSSSRSVTLNLGSRADAVPTSAAAGAFSGSSAASAHIRV